MRLAVSGGRMRSAGWVAATALLAWIGLGSTVLDCSAPAQNQRLLLHEIDTIGGTLKITREEPANQAKYFKVTLGAGLVAEERGYHSVFINDAFPRGEAARLVLLTLGSGGTGCPAVFKVVEVVSGGKARVSEEFGNCTDVFTTRWDGRAWRIELPAIGGAPAESWLYRDGKLTRLKPSSRP